MEIKVRETLKRHNLYAKKKYGQNFLVDPRVYNKIVSAVKTEGLGLVIEIGAGLGSLTLALSSAAETVVSYEIDAALIPVLSETISQCANVHVINADALKADFHETARQYGYKTCAVAANLPYYITTPLLFKILETDTVTHAVLMTQKEVADRILAAPGTSDYGALTVTAAFYSRAERVTNVPPNCFVPRPDVESSVVKFTLIPPAERICSPEERDALFSIIKAAFSMRRKTLVNCLASIGISKEKTAEMLSEMSLPNDVRGETLSLRQFAHLSRYCVP
jgi:16S rRNA (adenine1518-N6/adenine1519-N6)-dimethyltransferase